MRDDVLTREAVKLMVAEQDVKIRREHGQDARRVREGRAGRGINGAEHVSRIGKAAFFRAVSMEGREILTDAGKTFWNDQERIYPHLRGMGDGIGMSLNGERSRHGRATIRFRDGCWWRRGEDGQWRRESAACGRKGSRGRRGKGA
jgi:hypothetical protein